MIDQKTRPLHIRVRAYPSAGKESVIRLNENAFEIYVTEPAERNLANKKITSILSAIHRDEKVRLVSGHRGASKIFEIG